MRERDIHNLIEQQDPEAKQRIWEKVSAGLNLADTQPAPAVKAKKKSWIWCVAVVAVCLVTLAIVLPVTLGGGGGEKFCDVTQYTRAKMNQTLKEYSQSHKDSILYVNWYDVAEEIIGEYAHMNGDEKDVVYLKEYIYNGETDEELTLWVTDNKTRVDVLEGFHKDCQELSAKNVNVKYKTFGFATFLATFEYKKQVYYLQIDGIDSKERLIEIIETMLP